MSIRFMDSTVHCYCSNRLSAQPGDLVGVLVAATGEADDQNLAGPEPPGFLERLGQGVARLEGGEDAFVLGGDVVGVEGLGVGDRSRSGPGRGLSRSCARARRRDNRGPPRSSGRPSV